MAKGFICMITGCSLKDKGSLMFLIFFFNSLKVLHIENIIYLSEKTLEMFYDIETQYGKFVHCPFRDRVFFKSVMSFPS